MTLHRFTPLLLLLFTVLTMASAALALPQPVALRVFYSANLYGEILPCG